MRTEEQSWGQVVSLLFSVLVVLVVVVVVVVVVDVDVVVVDRWGLYD
jgi:hypothetical protein